MEGEATDNPPIADVLIVEDEPVVAQFIRDTACTVFPDGRVEVSGSLEDARRTLRQLHRPLVLLDVGLPDGEGP
ncbi:hypothetical protein RDV64_05770 [Acuticoccus sp. MNP-M23]|uniref:response regulator n=1 Tax=Acuticoccus sp. MNP-M23 TaxID=3072793 RepID=UPI0028156EB2|nr:hypothetical protein [Acuticoccus sp. MNP-M23]WMS43898.1 hypothetical protein RDV64_05770 [Acuticoccus sp. MNP-M23]